MSIPVTKTSESGWPRAGETSPRWRSLGREALRTGVEWSPLGDRIFWRLPERVHGVALTFDDGPDPEQTPRILDVLAAAGARATFFVLGERALRYPEVVRRIVAEGHGLGNHTFWHVKCRGLSRAAFAEEIRRTDEALRSICPQIGGPVFRPPFGSIAPRQAWDLARQGRRVALWSRDARDYREASIAEIAELGDTMQARDIVLLHDRFPATLDALEAVLAGLARRGLRTVTLGEPLEPTRGMKRKGRE